MSASGTPRLALLALAALSLISLLLIFVVLYSRYKSAILALIIMGNVPLALIATPAGRLPLARVKT